MGPLTGVRVVEIGGIGPGPFAAMLLADMGADVVRIDRPSRPRNRPATDMLRRGRPSVAVELKAAGGPDVVLRLVEKADILTEGFRPGVMERLGLGPDDCWERNRSLTYGRMTGWGQTGPLAHVAGHDINYISMSGALRSFARRGQRPVPPITTVGDFGGGGMLLLAGVLAAYIEAQRSGIGQVVDAAMVDGSALLLAQVYGMSADGHWHDEPGTNLVDTGAPFYDVYETSDGHYISIGPIESRFYATFLELVGLDAEDLPAQMDRTSWGQMKVRFEELFASRTRDEWVQVLGGTDSCFAPVLTLDEARRSAQAVAREAFIDVDGVVQPAPAPRFSRTPSSVTRGPAVSGAETDPALLAWGFTRSELDALRRDGVIGNPE